MDLILYRYLLRRLVSFPVTFSRNKNFNSYNSEEGNLAIKRAKIIKVIIDGLNSSDNTIVKKVDGGYSVIINNEALHLESEYFIDEFEKELLKEKLDSNSFYGFE